MFETRVFLHSLQIDVAFMAIISPNKVIYSRLATDTVKWVMAFAVCGRNNWWRDGRSCATTRQATIMQQVDFLVHFERSENQSAYSLEIIKAMGIAIYS